MPTKTHFSHHLEHDDFDTSFAAWEADRSTGTPRSCFAFIIAALFCLTPFLTGCKHTIKDQHAEVKPPKQCVQLKDGMAISKPLEKAPPMPLDKELYRPMTEKELTCLIGILTPVEFEGKVSAGYIIKGAKKEIKLSTERIGVLLQDITAVLTRVHLEETLTRLKGMPDMDKARMAWGTEMLGSLDDCGRFRYDDFGGEIAFVESMELVMDYRVTLESLILKGSLFGCKNGPPCGDISPKIP